MGADIHTFVEVLDPTSLRWNAVWHPLHGTVKQDDENSRWPKLKVPRDYRLFGVLAHGVHTAYPFSFFQRGFPQGSASDEVVAQFARELTDAHSASWLTYEELFRKSGYLMVCGLENALDAKTSLDRFIDLLPQDPNYELNQQRIVFWFDN